ncbi:Putative glycosyltransferase EpsE [Stieleria bergensis]|uniref:Glycosyltransferase EpsE n=1 Tax=Stieleria bergensis TaxID=2528025 RepID=A0A517SXD2_9BACT|nr:Putative glycosyltransferase EpsE [Planctomycetes bacterium SV_7m_r]
MKTTPPRRHPSHPLPTAKVLGEVRPFGSANGLQQRIDPPSDASIRVPTVSVVMGVHNGELTVAETIDSMLCQSLSAFEFIIVDDGSTDTTAERLQRYANQDSRIRLVHQENRGLTAALQRGCSLAQGKYIARCDAGDWYAPERLERQLAVLEDSPEIVAVGGGGQRVGPDGEYLFTDQRNAPPAVITQQLKQADAAITHAVAMYRTTVYQQVGGYRDEFTFAQDIDLWLRMVEHGLLAEIPEMICRIRIEPQGISLAKKVSQWRLAEIAYQCAALRAKGQDESTLLREAANLGIAKQPAQTVWGKIQTRLTKAKSVRFVGNQLFVNRDARCRHYYLQSLAINPTSPTVWSRWLASWLLCRHRE